MLSNGTFIKAKSNNNNNGQLRSSFIYGCIVSNEMLRDNTIWYKVERYIKVKNGGNDEYLRLIKNSCLTLSENSSITIASVKRMYVYVKANNVEMHFPSINYKYSYCQKLKVRILDEYLKIRNKKEIILDSKFTGNYNNVKNVHSKIVFTPPQRFHVCHYCNKLMKINNSTNNMQNTKHFCGHVCCIDCSKTVSTSKLIKIGVPNACPICEGLCDCKTCVKQGNENIQLKTIKKDQHCFACGKDIQPTTNKYICKCGIQIHTGCAWYELDKQHYFPDIIGMDMVGNRCLIAYNKNKKQRKGIVEAYSLKRGEILIMLDDLSKVTSNKYNIHERERIWINGSFNNNSISVTIYPDEPSYCICRLNDFTGADYVCCDGCNEWYHPICLRNRNKDGLTVMNLDDSKQNFFCPFCINQNVVASAKSNNTTSGETNRSESNVKRKEKNKKSGLQMSNLNREDRLMQQYMDQIQKAESIKKRKASREAKIREKEKKKQRLLELKNNNSTEFVCYLCKTNEEKKDASIIQKKISDHVKQSLLKNNGYCDNTCGNTSNCIWSRELTGELIYRIKRYHFNEDGKLSLIPLFVNSLGHLSSQEEQQSKDNSIIMIRNRQIYNNNRRYKIENHNYHEINDFFAKIITQCHFEEFQLPVSYHEESKSLENGNSDATTIVNRIKNHNTHSTPTRLQHQQRNISGGSFQGGKQKLSATGFKNNVNEGKRIQQNRTEQRNTRKESRNIGRTVRGEKPNKHASKSRAVGISGIDQLATTRAKQLRFGRSKIHSWGIFADENISSNSFIIEYKGEVIRPILSEVRQDRLYIDEPDYMFRIDNEVVIDATTRGSLARYINHSCDPNCYTKIISVDGEKKISIYSKKDIEKGEELHYDYKFPYEEDSSKKIKCYCGMPRCKGYLN